MRKYFRRGQTQPANIIQNGLDIFGVFFGRICIVMHTTAIAQLSRFQNCAYGLGMTNVKISVGLWRKASQDLPTMGSFRRSAQSRVESLCVGLRFLLTFRCPWPTSTVRSEQAPTRAVPPIALSPLVGTEPRFHLNGRARDLQTEDRA